MSVDDTLKNIRDVSRSLPATNAFDNNSQIKKCFILMAVKKDLLLSLIYFHFPFFDVLSLLSKMKIKIIETRVAKTMGCFKLWPCRLMNVNSQDEISSISNLVVAQYSNHDFLLV